MTTLNVRTYALLFGLLCITVSAQTPPTTPPPTQTPPAQPPPPPQQPTDIALTISGEGGAPPKYAVPDFLALSNDRETTEGAKTIGDVLFKDLEFEREFYLIARDTYGSIPRPSSIETIPFDRWRELGADGVVMGSVRRVDKGVQVQVKLYNVRTQQAVFSREYTGSAANPRLYAHTVADEIHQQQRALRGVARTKLTFSSDRDSEALSGTVENRSVQEIYIADYDGFNQRRVTVGRTLNITPVWSPDARSIAYTSYRKGFPDVLVSFIYQGELEYPAKGTERNQNFLPSWSPDGKRLAMVSNRDGNSEIYVMNADGSNPRRLTNHPAIDVTPTWSPTGNQIAFTSDRSGSPQIYIVDADGAGLRRVTTESYCDRPTWSPSPQHNEIAYASRTGPGYDIKVYDVSTGTIRQITGGEGSNESPAFAPNGRHLIFTSTRNGKAQIFSIARDGRDVRQLTRDGNNRYPHWSQ
jgi:TolB protein